MERQVDVNTLQPYTHSAAGHDGVLCDPSMEIFVKPCTSAEVAFYEQTHQEHEDLTEFMPTYLGTVKLGVHSDLAAAAATATIGTEDVRKTVTAPPDTTTRGKKISSELGIVLENLEYGFTRANVIDVKMGARLYADDTARDKMERLDKVAASTTSGSLNLRITGMRVWNGNDYDVYDKFYGRKFDATNVIDGFATFFSGLTTSLSSDDSRLILEAVTLEIANLRLILERNESRMYGGSVLILYEGDASALDAALGRGEDTRHDDIPPSIQDQTSQAQQQQMNEEQRNYEVLESHGDEDSDDEETDMTPFAFKVRFIDFAHSSWTPGQGIDENVIKGLHNLERLMRDLIIRLDEAQS